MERSEENDDIQEMVHLPQKTKATDFNDFRWMLSSMALIASFYNSLGMQRQCENVYAEYIARIEEFYRPNSIETGNAYFNVGVYYFEQEQLQKALACFLKCLYIRI